MGTVIGGRYEVTSRLGKGGMATIYGARDRRLLRDVAVKVLDPTLVSERGLRMFNREARAIAALRHNHIVQVYDYSGPEESPPFIVMELVDGLNLDVVIKRYSPLPEPVILTVLARVASALAHAHERGVIHRDLKPANVMLERAGRVLLADFGIAKAYANPARLGGTVAGTNTGVMGTPAFMAPEQLVEEPVGPPTDVFSLGSLTYCMATSLSPFECGTDVVEVLRRIVDVEFGDLQQARPDLSRDLTLQLDACLQRQPDARPTAEEVAELCNVWLHQQEVHAPERVIAELLQSEPGTVVTGIHLDTNDVVVEVQPGDDERGGTEPVSGDTAPVERGDTAPVDERGGTEVVNIRPVEPVPMAESRGRQRQRVPRPEFVSGEDVSGPTAVVSTPLEDSDTELVSRVRRAQPAGSKSVGPEPRSGRGVIVGLLVVLVVGGAIAAWMMGRARWVRGDGTLIDVPVAPKHIEPSPVEPVRVEPVVVPEVEKPEPVEPEPEPESVEPVEPVEPEPGTAEGKRRKGKRGRRKAKAAESVDTPVVATPGKGIIEVMVKPWGTVFIDGVKRGNTPVFRSATVTAGRHMVMVRHPSLGEVEKFVVVNDGDHDVLRIDLNP